MSEKAVVERVKNVVRLCGGKAIKIHGDSYTQSGTPDVVGCIRGRMVVIECKLTGGVLTAIQLQRLRDWAMYGAIALIVTEVSVDKLAGYLPEVVNGKLYPFDDHQKSFDYWTGVNSYERFVKPLASPTGGN